MIFLHFSESQVTVETLVNKLFTPCNRIKDLQLDGILFRGNVVRS